MKKKKFVRGEGICPECGSGFLDYQDTQHADESIGYDFECIDCGFIGTEWYNLSYDETVAR